MTSNAGQYDTTPPAPAHLESGLEALRDASDPHGTSHAVLLPREASALLAKIEAADRLAKAAATDIAFCEKHGGCCMERTARALATYRNPAPAAEGE